jgi:hypothetical protein
MRTRRIIELEVENCQLCPYQHHGKCLAEDINQLEFIPGVGYNIYFGECPYTQDIKKDKKTPVFIVFEDCNSYNINDTQNMGLLIIYYKRDYGPELARKLAEKKCLELNRYWNKNPSIESIRSNYKLDHVKASKVNNVFESVIDFNFNLGINELFELKSENVFYLKVVDLLLISFNNDIETQNVKLNSELSIGLNNNNEILYLLIKDASKNLNLSKCSLNYLTEIVVNFGNSVVLIKDISKSMGYMGCVIDD